MMKVSAGSETKSVAKCIAAQCRQNEEPPTMLTIGAASINQAMKVRHRSACTSFC